MTDLKKAIDCGQLEILFVGSISKRKNLINLITAFLSINENDLNNYPIAKEPKVALPNNHLQYSITWGMLDVIFLIMNYIYLRKNK